MDWPKEMF